ncbi:hypothetical protein V8B97DRAFT_13449 [Scleroderma yunnanense]
MWWTVQGILQMRLYALYHCSKKFLVVMIVLFAAEVAPIMWILISDNLLSRGTIFVYRISFPGYGNTDTCATVISTAFTYIWVPCLIFEGLLCLFAIYAGIKHSRDRSRRSTKSNRYQLIDILVQGNVVYFLSPLGMFILFVINTANLKAEWLADTLLFRAPITILAGCRLILSIREAASPPLPPYPSLSNFADSTVVFGDRSNLSHV